jgi:hypothetical protein
MSRESATCINLLEDKKRWTDQKVKLGDAQYQSINKQFHAWD